MALLSLNLSIFEKLILNHIIDFNLIKLLKPNQLNPENNEFGKQAL